MGTCVESLGECGKIIGPGFGITLSHRTIVLKDNHRASPKFGSRTRGDTGNCLIYRRIAAKAAKEYHRCNGKTQRFPIKTLSQDSTVSLSWGSESEFDTLASLIRNVCRPAHRQQHVVASAATGYMMTTELATTLPAITAATVCMSQKTSARLH